MKENNIIDTSNYMLVNEDKNFDLTNTKKVEIKSLQLLGCNVSNLTHSLNLMSKNNKSSNNLYRITNLGAKDSLNTTKSGITYGVVNKSNGKKLAQLEKVSIDNTNIIMGATLYEIEKQINELIDLSKKIFSFLENDKESEIEADIDLLNNIIREFKYNYQDKQYLTNNHKHVMDIKRTAKKNINFYKKQITNDILKNNIVITNQIINSLIGELENKFKYYRLSLYIYSYCSLLEILLLGNYNEEYLLTKKEELSLLDEEYSNNFLLASNFTKKNANKSLEGNFLKGIGSAGKTIGNLIGKVSVMKDKKVDEWFDETGNKLEKSGNDIKDKYSKKLDEISESNINLFISKIADINCIHNRTKEIYCDDENIYLDIK